MKEQVMAWAKQAGIDAWWESGNERREELDDLLTTLATLVRNAALEDAKQLFSQPHQEYFGREAQDAIESLKEPTP